jgi:hypothetical protein
LLLLFGNPAPDSVIKRCFFAGEKGKKEHRFWPALKESGIISFKNNAGHDINIHRTKALFDLDYDSDFRIGLAVFYSMPSPASDPKWSGVAGLRKFFGARALRLIAECERTRVEELIEKFVAGNDGGAVIAFQKDAYLEIKKFVSKGTELAGKDKWCVVEARCSHSNVKLFRLPPTRYMIAPRYLNSLREVWKLCKSPEER